MKASKFSEAQIAFVLKQAEDGSAVAEVCRKAGISEATFYNWRKKYAGLMPSEMKRLRQLEEENGKLKRIVANGKFRTECLNAHWFLSLDDARQKMEDWRRDYNEVRPHSAIGNKAPISLLNGSSAPPPA
ncbi:transposase [Bradyrhizobium sp. 177]|nr:transposase [Bradyrhizobium sp. 177]